MVELDPSPFRSRSQVGLRPSRNGRHAGLRLALFVPLAAALLGSVACASRDPNRSGLLQPYRIGLPQGNYVTREQIDALKPGMSRDQVRYVLGSPLLNSMFRNDRWDYIYRYQHPSGRTDMRRVTVRFEADRVAAIDADALPEREDASDPALPGYRPPSATAQGGVR
jgi:outer membrane protein assembly factor BamE